MTDCISLPKKQHLALQSCPEVSAIMAPLLARHGMTVFNYYRMYFDGSVVRLSSDALWTEHFFRKNYLQKLSVPSSYLSKPLNFYIWLTEDCPEMLLDAAINFDTSNGISIAKYQENAIDYFCFASSTGNRAIVNNFYLNNIPTLLQYIDYFMEQSAPLRARAENNKLYVNDKYQQQAAKASVHLTPRQRQCGILLLQGHTQKEIAKHLALSPRTVETYINQLRQKLECRNKAELILKASCLT